MPPERDIDLVLITGAGASCQFGNSRSGGSATLPLMPEWSNFLVDRLARGSTYGAVEMVGLERDLDGPEFEKRLGSFLTLAEYFPDIERLIEPSMSFPDIQPQLSGQAMKQWHATVQGQIQGAIEIIHQSMIDNFGWERCNPDGAAKAYGKLFAPLQIGLSNTMVLATTNYDYIGESALERLGRRPDFGHRQAFAGPGVNSAVRLDVESLVATVGRYTPILHLHGAVGWFEQQGVGPTVINSPSFDKNWGTPIAMLPSLEKDYQQSTTIAAIWVEFRNALRRAKRVLILGHSLNDQELARALVEEVESMDRVAITRVPGAMTAAVPETIGALWPQLNEVRQFEVLFDSNFDPASIGLNDWRV